MIIGLTGHGSDERIMFNTNHIVMFRAATRDGQKVTHVTLTNAIGIDVWEDMYTIAEMIDGEEL